MAGLTGKLLSMGIPFHKLVKGVKIVLILILVLVILLDVKSIYAEKKKRDAQ